MSAQRKVLLFMLLVCNFLVAQNKQILYDFNEIPQSLMLNPGMESDFKWYSGIPLLSGISGYVGTNGVSVNDIFADDGVDINDKVRDRMVYALTPRDEFSGNVQLEFLNVGFRSSNPDIFYSLGAYLEMDEITYWPQDYAYLIFDGNADQLNRRFDLGDLKSRGSLVAVYHLGINKKIDNRLSIGARGKIYSVIIDYNSTRNRGYLLNIEGQNNILNTTLSADLELRTSGFGELDRASDNGTIPNTIMKRALFGGDLGLGVDLGFSYRFNEQTLLTASVLDLGFIYHSGDIQNYSLTGTASSEGIQINVLREFSNLNRDFWQDLVDEIEELVPFQETNTSYLTFRPTKVNASLRYDFGKTQGGSSQYCDCTTEPKRRGFLARMSYRNSVGGHLFMVNRPRGPQTAITAFYMRRFGNFLALKSTYTADKFSYTNLGLGLNLQAGPLNFYVMADNLLSYRNIAASNYASFQLGLNIISWARK